MNWAFEANNGPAGEWQVLCLIGMVCFAALLILADLRRGRF